MDSFTPEDLLQYLYKETSPEKTAAIAAAIESDFSLREKWETIVAATKRLDALQFSPSKDSIDKIMQYAAKVEEESKHHV